MPGLLDAVDGFADVDGEADGAALIGDGAGDRLPDPRSGVGREFVAAVVVEVVGGLHQADVPLLNEIEEGEATADILLGHGNDETQVGPDQVGTSQLAVELVGVELAAIIWSQQLLQEELLGELAALHPFGEPDLLLHGEKVRLADFLEVES